MDASDRIECLIRTRHDIIDFIDQWMSTVGPQNMLWIHGLAGSEKSTLSTMIANQLHRHGQLGAFLLFD
jgi:adenylylsulfate kinase-like enzyme